MKTVNINRTALPYKRIDRGTIFGNPFFMDQDGNREEVIAKYRVYFYKRIESDPAFKKAVKELRGCNLGYWCSPLPCHGDVILEYLRASVV